MIRHDLIIYDYKKGNGNVSEQILIKIDGNNDLINSKSKDSSQYLYDINKSIVVEMNVDSII